MLKAASTIVGVSGRVFDSLDAQGNKYLDVQKLATTMEAVGRWMTAAGVGADEAARATAVLYQNAGLSAGALERAFDVVTMGGKLGGFEAADSARWFPGMLSSYGAIFSQHVTENTQGMSAQQAQTFRDQLGLGMVANLTAYLQMARLGAADAQIAGNNLVNVIQKLMIKETSDHYRKVMGIDFRQLIHQATLLGDDPIFEVIKSVAALVDKHGGNMLHIGGLFGDRQALEGLMPIVNMYRTNRAEFDRLLKEIREASGPTRASIISADLQTALATTSVTFRMLRHSIAQFWNEIGLRGGGGSLSFGFGLIALQVRRLNELMRSNSGLTTLIVRTGFAAIAAVGGLVLLRFALAGLSLAFAHAGMGAITLLRLTPGLRVAGAILSRLGFVGGALGILGRLGLVGGIGFLAYQHWHLLGGYIGPVLTMISGFFERLVVLFPSLSGILGWFPRLLAMSSAW